MYSSSYNFQTSIQHAPAEIDSLVVKDVINIILFVDVDGRSGSSLVSSNPLSFTRLLTCVTLCRTRT